MNTGRSCARTSFGKCPLDSVVQSTRRRGSFAGEVAQELWSLVQLPVSLSVLRERPLLADSAANPNRATPCDEVADDDDA